MKQFVTFLLILFSCQWGFSQLEISGTVKDGDKPIPYASVVLKDTTQKIVTFAVTDEEGEFVLKAEKGQYNLEITNIGYPDWKKDINLEDELKLGTIKMDASAYDLGVVEVKSRVPLFEQKPDRLIYNVSASVAASGGNVLEALNVAPGITVETDAIMMLGKGAAGIMLNGRLLNLNGEDLVNFLNSISADDIKKIEIIKNPPAKYDAGGGGGLINIIYKKGIRESWTNSTTLGYSQNKYGIGTFRNSFLYNKNKLRFSLNLNGDKGAIRELETVKTFYPSGLWDNSLDVKKYRDGLTGRAALDYDISKNTTIGVQYLGNFRRPDEEDRSITNIFNTSSELDSIYESIGFEDHDVNSSSINVHLISTLDTLGRVLSFDFDYFQFDNEIVRDYVVNILSPNNEFKGVNQSAILDSDQAITNYSGRVDVEHPFKKFNLGYGAKLSYTTTINDLQNFNTISGTSVFDPTLSNEFEYEEDIQAVYVNGSKRLNSKWSIQAGLRLENTITKGFSKTLDQTNKNDYLQLFPTFYTSYVKNRDNIFTLNYSRRIRRPNFRDLNPFRTFRNSNNFSEGNPFLQPSFSHHVNFTYTRKYRWMTDVFYNLRTDGFGVVFSSDEETNVQAIIRDNYYTEHEAGIGQVYVYTDIPWWVSQNQAYLMGQNSVFDDDIDAEPRLGITLNAGTYNTFILGKDSKLQVDFSYRSQNRSILYTNSPTYSLNIGLKQTFMDKKMQLSIFAQDIFDTGSQRSVESEVNGVLVDFGSNYSRRFVRVSLKYNFGNRKVKVRDRDFGSEDERNRSN